MLGIFPTELQARFWCWFCRKKFGHTSHFKIEAIKRLRKSANLTFKESKGHIDRLTQ